MVVFVPSYDFLNLVQARWERTGMIKRLGQKKKVRCAVHALVASKISVTDIELLYVILQTFWEPKASADVDLTLREYSAANAGAQPVSL